MNLLKRIFGKKRKAHSLPLSDQERKALIRIIVTGRFHGIDFVQVPRLEPEDMETAVELLERLGVRQENVRGVTDNGKLEIIGRDFTISNDKA